MYAFYQSGLKLNNNILLSARYLYCRYCCLYF